MNTFTELCNELGVPIAEDKTTHPTTRLTFLGLEIDTVDMVVRIPVAKLIKLRSQLHPMTIKRKIKFKDLESLVGLLAFCSRAVPSSRAFLRRFYDVIASFKVKKPFFSIRITSEIREDVLVCAGNAELGCGSYFNGKWAQFKWPDSWVGLHILQDITFLELIPILLALCIWAPLLKNSKILFRTDNIALVDILNKRTSKSKRVMSIIRPFVLRSMNYNIQFKAKHIVGAKNNIADASLSFSVRKVQKVSTIGGGYTRNNPSGVHRPDLQGEIDRLIVSAVAPNTSKVYQQALRSFKEFRTLFQFEDLWPIPLHHITNYIAYMSFHWNCGLQLLNHISLG
ncbi:Hypothetical predicted protein [Mytilus galloprovincialis]|uniref:Reverse transcriptase RNase H-like domain-containing protein n=1 Tax=Mytilus galloprovincialis TaxID=29158 RepID=A0A8B6EWE7_MYTGA|nr:Hypothetical predicted protein [Mytilus galloprovincialis]